ncbi:hypothetical protein C7N43_34990 [Sphingobacteriales bacterium UPWRP_1]|nr:hypothetical protein BVG80_07585 [Sphingobacteriales bacterium TSM_CSM]PSJ72299.1 hypothetical protein C7N43_34990 [Sphingobacteriales bacterium UPWRP_1]
MTTATKTAQEIKEMLAYGDINTIAQRCKVSRETVRRVLNGTWVNMEVLAAAVAVTEERALQLANLSHRLEALKKGLLALPAYAQLAAQDPDAFEVELINAHAAGIEA